MTVGQRLRELRGEKSREEVAEKVEITVSALSNYENDIRRPRDETKQRLAKYFGCTIQELFY